LFSVALTLKIIPKVIQVIQAAEQLGIYIPRYCYHPGLSIAGNCRICLVEVEKSPKLQIACNVYVTEGMVVHTKSEKAEDGRRAVLEFLLANHPLDCSVCDQSGECDLQNFYMNFGLYNPRFKEHKVKKAHVELGLEIAKASIVAINPASSVAQVQDEIKALKARIDKVSAYPDLSKDDTATIAYKQTLRKTIHEVRVGRNKNIVGKKDQAVVDTLNKEISKADKVRANAKSTVAQVDTAVDQLRAAYQTALNAPDKAKK